MGGGGGPGREIPEQVIQDALNNDEDFTLDENETTNLTKILIIPEGRTLTNNGTIDLGEAGLEIQGSLINNGTITNNEASIEIKTGSAVTNNGTIDINGNLYISVFPGGIVSVDNNGFYNFNGLFVTAGSPIDIKLLAGSQTKFKYAVFEGEFLTNPFSFTGITNDTNPDQPVLEINKFDIPTPLRLSNVILKHFFINETMGSWEAKDLTLSNNTFIVGNKNNTPVLEVTEKLTIEDGPVTIFSRINIGAGAILEINNSILKNSGTINNEGTIKQFENTNSSIEADSFGKIITTGTVTGLNLKNQQITTDGDGIVIAGTKNEADKILKATAKTIEWDEHYNPGAGDEDFKVKRSTADEKKFEIEFVLGKVTYLKDGEESFPSGGSPFTNAKNPGFTINTWYKEHNGIGGAPFEFGILT
tara:strand:+ start:3104 stop:4357 length:1254 start_codon:yes stop_codon:yes gene_type:complete